MLDKVGMSSNEHNLFEHMHWMLLFTGLVNGGSAFISLWVFVFLQQNEGLTVQRWHKSIVNSQHISILQ